MPRASRRTLARPRADALGPRLLEIERTVVSAGNLARDPLRFPRRYADPADVEIAALVSAQLAYGRVDLFGPVIERVLAVADDHGGPAAFVRGFDDARAVGLAGVSYRWNKETDFVQLFGMLRRVFERHGSLGALFSAGPAAASLGGAVDTLRAFAPPDATRGLRTWLSHPGDGSACKRWLMLMRWMVRRGAPDLGLWTHLSPRDLVIPLDTHVLRVSGYLGLTRRTDGSWRTAEDVTAALRAFDAEDPVRFDFALAHLGISGACLGHRDAAVCPACPLDAVCAAPIGSARPRPSRGARHR